MPYTFDPNRSRPLELPEHDSWPATRHAFDDESVWAVRAAISARRPLLLRGEPGIGKSQLARAVAVALGVPFLPHVVDERSERDDLLYSYDAVSRLAQAQVSGLAARDATVDWRGLLEERNFFRPGVLWWAFDWTSAADQAERFRVACRRCPEPLRPADWTPSADKPCGPVVLVDEIDKADPAVPNGLLESLGNEGFQTAQLGAGIRLARGAKPPLVMITTNEERELPAAFVRRCLVFRMPFPKDEQEARQFLAGRARVFWEPSVVSQATCDRVAEVLLADRTEATRFGRSKPGAAEFLDVLRVLADLHPGDAKSQLEILERVRSFTFQKHPDDTP